MLKFVWLYIMAGLSESCVPWTHVNDSHVRVMA